MKWLILLFPCLAWATPSHMDVAPAQLDPSTIKITGAMRDADSTAVPASYVAKVDKGIRTLKGSNDIMTGVSGTANNTWGTLSYLWVFGVDTVGHAQIEWINATTDITIASPNTFTAGTGLGCAAHKISTGHVLSTDAKYALNDASMFDAVETNASANVADVGAVSGTTSSLNGRSVGGNIFGATNSSTGHQYSTATSVGVAEWVRSASNVEGLAKNGTNSSGSITSTAIASGAFQLCGDSGSASSRTLGGAGFGSHHTTGQITDVYNFFHNFGL